MLHPVYVGHSLAYQSGSTPECSQATKKAQLPGLGRESEHFCAPDWDAKGKWLFAAPAYFSLCLLHALIRVAQMHWVYLFVLFLPVSPERIPEVAYIK